MPQRVERRAAVARKERIDHDEMRSRRNHIRKRDAARDWEEIESETHRQDREQIYEHESEPEDRDRNADEHGAHRENVEGARTTQCGEDARGYADRDRDEQRTRREFDGCRKILRELRYDGLRIDERTPEIAVEKRAKIEEELDVPRPIETEGGPQAKDLIGRGVIAEPQRHGIARDRLHEGETRECNRNENEGEPHDAAYEECRHARIALIEKSAACA